MMTTLRTTAFGLFMAAMPSVSQAQQIPPQTPSQLTFDANELPLKLDTGKFYGALRRGYQSGEVTWESISEKVEIKWTSSSLENQPIQFSSNHASSNYTTNSRDGKAFLEERQIVLAGYYVTAVGRFDVDSLLVAGVSSIHGGAKIERWDFGWPSASAIPTIDPNTSLETVQIVIPSVTKVPLYAGPAESLASHKFITGICALQVSSGVPKKAILQYHEPNDLFELTFSSGQLSLLGGESATNSPLGSIGTLSIKDYSGISVYEHVSLGLVYFFKLGSPGIHAPYGGALVGTQPVNDHTVRLHLIDADMNGSIDYVHETSTNQAKAQGYLTIGNYKNWWLH